MNIKPINYQQNTTFGCAGNKIIPTHLNKNAIDEICVAYHKTTGNVLNPELLKGDHFVKPSKIHAKEKNGWTDLACVYNDQKGKPLRQVEFMKNNDQWRVFMIREFIYTGNRKKPGQLIKYFEHDGDLYRVEYNGPSTKPGQEECRFDFSVTNNGDIK